MSGIVAIVGRPNVGKSTLFNRLIGERKAIVEELPGVTRDRLYGQVEWSGRTFTLIDTGGIEIEGSSDISVLIRVQVDIAIDEADLILFLVDSRDGLVRDDAEIAELLRRTEKPILLIVNKVDNNQQRERIYEFYSLGIGEPQELSALNGLNTGDLLDSILELIPPDNSEADDEDLLKISVIGRPNVGKSSLVNALLGDQRMIVSDQPGTTRDAIDSYFEHDGQKYLLVDTAGMRRKSRVYSNVERYAVIRALRSVDRCDIALVLIDAQDGVTDQDKRIAGYAHEQGKGMIIVVNKWDLLTKDTHTADRFTKELRNELIFCQYAPVITISAKTGQRLPRLLELTKAVAEQQTQRIATAGLNDWLQEALRMTPPPSDQGHPSRIYYVNQVSVKPPTFVFFCNNPAQIHFSYQRYLDNQIRNAYGFTGTPLRLIFRQR